MIRYLLMMSLGFGGLSLQAEDVWITLDKKDYSAFQNLNPNIMSVKNKAQYDGAVVFQIPESETLHLNRYFHETKHRCGGFFATSEHPSKLRKSRIQMPSNYSVTMEDTVIPLLNNLDQVNILQTIQQMESLHNRYYKSKTGEQASELVFNTWKDLTRHRSDFSVSYFNHPSWPQKSVILTWTGTQNPKDKVIIGGHLDSISGFWMPEYSKAPGADDNASGIATITEIIRTLAESNYAPKNTIVFMAYAAEEVGLRGSQEIAQSFVNANERVLGVVQFDMTNFSNGPQDISLMSDYTNPEQNTFMGKLIDNYVKVSWGYSKCGYACSDHASWHNARFKASMPFESVMEKMNGAIHTQNDTLNNLGNSTKHAFKFAQLGLSFAVEMGK